MIYFFSYGDHNYTTSKERIKNEAINCGYFDKVDIYGREDLTEDFLKKTEPYINAQKGGGYWLWKPFLLKKTFEKMNYGDYCLYADSGCTINPFGKETLMNYISLLDTNGSGIFRYSFGGTREFIFTNTKVFEYFNKNNDDEFMESDHLMATIMIFKKCQNSVNYIDKLLEIAESNPILFTDHYDEYKRHSKFKGHRHDQSVSSCLAKLYNAFEYQDETYASDIEEWRYLYNEKKIPVLATRIRG